MWSVWWLASRLVWKYEQKQYKSFSSLAKLVPNMLYFCNYNKCHLRLKHIVSEFARSSADTYVWKAFWINWESTSKAWQNLSVYFNRSHWKMYFISNQSSLQEELDSISRSLQNSSVSNVRITPSTAHNVRTTVVEELVERDRMKRILLSITYQRLETEKLTRLLLYLWLNLFATLKV